MGRTKTSIIAAGAQQSGKSFWAKSVAEKFCENGGFACVYNFSGSNSNFPNFELFELLTPAKVARNIRDKKQRAHVLGLYEVNHVKSIETGKVYKIKDLPKAYAGKGIKIMREPDFDRAFYSAVLDNFYNGLLILDDAKPLFANGVTRELNELLCKINHTGNRANPGIKTPGIDVITIFHGIDSPPREFFNLVNGVVLFKCLSFPEGKIDNDILNAATRIAVEKLSNMPKYSRIEISLQSERYKMVVIEHKQQ